MALDQRLLSVECTESSAAWRVGLILTPEELVIIRGRPSYLMLILIPLVLPVVEFLSFLFGPAGKAWAAFQTRDLHRLREKECVQFCSFLPRSAIREVRFHRNGRAFSMKVDKRACTLGRRSLRVPRWFKRSPQDEAGFQQLADNLQQGVTR